MIGYIDESKKLGLPERDFKPSITFADYKMTKQTSELQPSTLLLRIAKQLRGAHFHTSDLVISLQLAEYFRIQAAELVDVGAIEFFKGPHVLSTGSRIAICDVRTGDRCDTYVAHKIVSLGYMGDGVPKHLPAEGFLGRFAAQQDVARLFAQLL